MDKSIVEKINEKTPFTELCGWKSFYKTFLNVQELKLSFKVEE